MLFRRKSVFCVCVCCEGSRTRKAKSLPGGGRGDGLGQEGRAVGRAGGQGRETSAGTGDLAVAVVAGASTVLKNVAEGQAGEGEDDGGLHFDGLELLEGSNLTLLACPVMLEIGGEGMRREL